MTHRQIDCPYYSNNVSRMHCEVIVDGDSILLRDLGSTNGVIVNTKRIKEAELRLVFFFGDFFRDGDIVTIGGASGIKIGEFVNKPSSSLVFKVNCGFFCFAL